MTVAKMTDVNNHMLCESLHGKSPSPSACGGKRRHIQTKTTWKAPL